MSVDVVTTFRIYVGNIPDDATSDDIKSIFEEFGNVVECHLSGKNAFVLMEDDIEGRFAIGELQGKDLNGNTLVIEESNKNVLPGVPTVKLLVKNISPTVDARGLRNMFKKFGYVIEVEIRNENGEGHVSLEAIGDIKSAIKEMNGYKIDDMELSVEPGPTTTPATPSDNAETDCSTSSPTKSFKGYSSWESSWTKAKREYHGSKAKTKKYEEGYNYSSEASYDYDSSWSRPTRNPFETQPERIPRDPFAFQRGRGGRGALGGRGAMTHGGPSRVLLPPPPPPPHYTDPQMFGMPSMAMRQKMPPQRQRMPPQKQRGGGQGFRGDAFVEPPRSYHQEHFQPSNPFMMQPMQEDYETEEFYEDEPVSSIAQSNSNKYQPRQTLTGANAMPLSSAGPVFRNPGNSWPNRGGMARNGNARGGANPGGWGRGRQPKFTAMTEEVSPGEKYPVPPMYNPGFRAPFKKPKEEVKSKVKRKKKPLVPAELPDYSYPVPDLPKPLLPRGAVLKPFPPPQGKSLIDSDTFGGRGDTNFFSQQNNQ